MMQVFLKYQSNIMNKEYLNVEVNYNTGKLQHTIDGL